MGHEIRSLFLLIIIRVVRSVREPWTSWTWQSGQAIQDLKLVGNSHWMMAVPQIFTLGNGWLEITQNFHPRQTIANVYVFGVKWNEYVSNNHLVWATSILKLLDASAVLVLFFSNIYYCIPFLSKHMGSFVLPKKHVMFLEIVSFQWLHHCNRRGKCVSTNP